MPISEAPTSNDIKGCFPIPHPLKIEGPPTCESLTKLRKAQCQNATAIEHGNHDSGCLGLVLDPNVHFLCHGQQFTQATYPGLLLAYPANATDAQCKTIKQAHELELAACKITERVETLLKMQIHNAIEDAHSTGICDDTTGFGNDTILDVHTCPFATCGTLSTAEIEQNEEKLKAPFDPNHPLPTLFKRFKECQALASAAGDPISDKSLVNTAEHPLIATGQCNFAYRGWIQLPAAQKTCANLKQHFSKDFNSRKPTNSNGDPCPRLLGAASTLDLPAWDQHDNRQTCSKDCHDFCCKHATGAVMICDLCTSCFATPPKRGTCCWSQCCIRQRCVFCATPW